MSHVKKVEEDIVYDSASLPAVFFKIHLPLCYSFPVTDIESKNGSITGNEWAGPPGGGRAYTWHKAHRTFTQHPRPTQDPTPIKQQYTALRRNSIAYQVAESGDTLTLTLTQEPTPIKQQ